MKTYEAIQLITRRWHRTDPNRDGVIFDAWKVSGGHNARLRVEIMKAITGADKVTQKQAGITLLAAAAEAFARRHGFEYTPAANTISSRDHELGEFFAGWLADNSPKTA